jgi:hypothetical protein
MTNWDVLDVQDVFTEVVIPALFTGREEHGDWLG